MHRIAVLLCLILPAVALGQESIDLTGVAKLSPNAGRGVTAWFEQDRAGLGREYPLPCPARDARMAKFFGDWSKALAALDVSTQTAETKTEIDGLKKRVEGLAKELAKQAGERAQA